MLLVQTPDMQLPALPGARTVLYTFAKPTRQDTFTNRLNAARTAATLDFRACQRKETPNIERVGLAHVHSTTAEMMRRSGILEKVGADHIFPNLETAVTWAGTAVGT